jgi:hypothetical protein
MQISQAWEFSPVGRYHELAANFVRDRMLAAEFDHLADDADGQPGFEGPRLIVEARVEDAAIVAGLVAADGALFFYNSDFGAGQSLAQTEGCSQSDYTAANNQHITSTSRFVDYRILFS